MTYKGHVHNGVIVLDDPVSLPEGAPVAVEIFDEAPAPADMPLAGKHFVLRDPFSPVVDPGDWEANR